MRLILDNHPREYPIELGNVPFEGTVEVLVVVPQKEGEPKIMSVEFLRSESLEDQTPPTVQEHKTLEEGIQALTTKDTM